MTNNKNLELSSEELEILVYGLSIAIRETNLLMDMLYTRKIKQQKLEELTQMVNLKRKIQDLNSIKENGSL